MRSASHRVGLGCLFSGAVGRGDMRVVTQLARGLALASDVGVQAQRVIPRRDERPTPWQQETGQAIAKAYGVVAFDPLTFACTGSGDPIGYPILEIDVEPEEWEMFRPVDRDRGDSLLGMVWIPNAPPGW